MRFLILLPLAIILAAVACGGGESNSSPAQGGSAEDAFRRQFDARDKGQWGREWDELHPAQQALVPRDKFMACRESADFPSVKKINVLETYEEKIDIPGTGQKVQSTAVTAEVTLSSGLLENTTRDTVHEVLVDGQWRWVTSDPADAINC